MAVIIGTPGNNLITGTAQDDTIDAAQGDDTVRAGAGNDSVQGNQGNDLLEGGDGDDILRGGDGEDELLGGAGNDTLFSTDGTDTLYGGEGDDFIDFAFYFELFFGPPAGYGEEGNDSLRAGRGSMLLDGGAGDDTLQGYIGFQNGDVTLVGGDGSDLFQVTNLDIVLDWNAEDLLVVDSEYEGEYFSLDQVEITQSGNLTNYSVDDSVFVFEASLSGELSFSVENAPSDILIAPGGEVTQGSGVAYRTYFFRAGIEGFFEDKANGRFELGSPGDVTLIGGDVQDTLVGQNGNDVLIADEDSALESSTGVWLIGHGGADLLIGAVGNDSLAGGVGNDTLQSGGGEDLLFASEGDDLVEAGAGNDSVEGGLGADLIVGGDGDDLLIGDVATADMPAAEPFV